MGGGQGGNRGHTCVGSRLSWDACRAAAECSRAVAFGVHRALQGSALSGSCSRKGEGPCGLLASCGPACNIAKPQGQTVNQEAAAQQDP